MFLTKQEITQNKKKKEIKELVNPINITTNRMHWWGTLGAPWWPYNAYCSFKSVNECNLWDKQTLNLFLKICVTHLDSLTNWGGRMYFLLFIFNLCVQPWTKTISLTTKGGWEKRYKSLPKNKRQKRARKKKRRYMKSSCRWAIIHFHFEVLWTVVKCDCMWQSPSLPVYHDGCTLPPRWCCTACVCACTNTDRRMNTERHRSGIMLGRCTQKQNYKPSGYTHALTCRYTLF